ncbi:MAG TPA: helix-turn-helix domain-containing protein [Oculatellaceae cyanobacterium]
MTKEATISTGPFAGESLSPKQVSEEYNIPKYTLMQLRKNGNGPLFQKVSHKIVRYRRSDVEQWLKEQTKRFNQQTA